MDFVFDIRKSIAAAGYVCQLNAGSFDMLKLIKTLYLADRYSILTWHRPITGDKFVSMKNGPVLSRVYDLIKGKVMGSDRDAWDETFNPLEQYTVSVKKVVNTKPLARREMEALKAAFEKIQEIPSQVLVSWLHEALPEWKDPKGSSTLIDPVAILQYSGLTSEEIAEIEMDLTSHQAAKTRLQSV